MENNTFTTVLKKAFCADLFTTGEWTTPTITSITYLVMTVIMYKLMKVASDSKNFIGKIMPAGISYLLQQSEGVVSMQDQMRGMVESWELGK